MADDPNEAPITELYAVLSIDENGEGILATAGMLPMVTSRRRIAEKMKLGAIKIAQDTGRPLKLVRFSRVETMWSSVS
jgi:hypothetical protein